ncbi:MAG TPA: GNAT family N-acetyltransferase [Planococcus sp. (in: firmicutes)]|nr:GNAT family N-acetyltransferase [Planococcus sp. (in: firmicutes)]
MLSAKQLSDIEKLQKEVEAHDALELKLNWDMLRARDCISHDFFYYENECLIAFIGLYPFASTVEVTGMVKPDERRKGHFTQLFEEAMATVNRIGFKKILLNAPAGSHSAKEFLKKQGATYSFSEHQMHWQPQPLEDSSGFTLRKARPGDLDMRVRLDVETFDIPEEDAVATESKIDGDEDTDMLMIDVNDETIGKIRVKREDGQAWIYGFSILPSHQGQGIGRNVLRHIVKQQSQLGHSVHLEVEANNARALSLYEAIGFQVVHAQDYYLYEP